MGIVLEKRKDAGLSQGQVAKLIGIERSSYTHIELGRMPSIKTAKALAALFRCTIDEILSEVTDSPPQEAAHV